jgi:hypothetical protein
MTVVEEKDTEYAVETCVSLLVLEFVKIIVYDV